jgi:cell division protein ZapA (FtsZ GTPase activity inhibitor)
MKSTSSSSSIHEAAGLSNYASSIASSLTVDEMRELHRQALAEAEAKQTELRIVLASRYRDLVGSSEQVLDMRHCAQELDSKLRNLPERMNQLHTCIDTSLQFHTFMSMDSSPGLVEQNPTTPVEALRQRLFHLPKVLFECIDRQDVLGAASTILDFFILIQRLDPKKESISNYSLAWAVLQNKVFPEGNRYYSHVPENVEEIKRDVVFQTQMKLTFLQLQTIPTRLIHMSKNILLQPSELLWSQYRIHAYPSACALATYDLLTLRVDLKEDDRASRLMDLYLTSKATLIQQLLNQFSLSSNASTASSTATTHTETTNNDPQCFDGDRVLPHKAEDILTLLVSVLQYDVILFSFHIFILRRFLSEDIQDPQLQEQEHFVMSTLPRVDPDMVKNKVSQFLSIHLPLIRAKAKTVLASISTASRLGNIRQLLYDKTDGADVLKCLGSWEDAIQVLIDTKVVFHALDGSNLPTISGTFTSSSYSMIGKETNLSKDTTPMKKFSLWNSLFSHVFSSLVHSILTSSFQSVHSRVITSLRSSLACAPSYQVMLPHEAHRNMLRIAMELDTALKKLRDDAHELLVHAEEREESERRLKHSLYVQTCEIMGRLIHEIRRILSTTTKNIYHDSNHGDDDEEEATKELIVGRLCHILRFRLTALPMLLDPTCASSHGNPMTSSLGGLQSSGMISTSELQSAFSIADDDDDGYVSVDEAMDVMESGEYAEFV